nr:unnamed protein product [Leishmania braziliensis]
MSHQPSSAEELYELVCALQKEQQLTHVDLRTVQRRTEALRQELQRQQELIAEEQARQEELAAKLTQGCVERRLAEAHARGVARASADAAQELCFERRAFVQKCHDYVLSVGKGPTDRGRFDLLLLPSKGTILSTATDGSCSGTFTTAAVEAGREASFLPAAAVHQLLLSLSKKLTRCIEVGATAVLAPLNVPSTVTLTTEERSREKPSDRRPSAVQWSTATVVATLMAARITTTNPHRPSSAHVMEGNVGSAADGQRSPHEKKRIGFAPASCFERVTTVPAANVNRGTSQAHPVEGSPSTANNAAVVLPSANIATDCSNHPAHACLRSGSCPRTQRPSGHFTVRLASRSATLVAEAAALGAKRQRSSEAAKITQSSPPKAARADGDKGASTCTVPQCANVTAALAPTYTNDRDHLVASVDLPLLRSAETQGNGNSRSSRRSVWTWTRGTTYGD